MSYDVDANSDVGGVAKLIQPSDRSSGTIISPSSTDIKLAATAKPAYFTEGELLPWKGTWWRVWLREINGEKLLTLVKVKPTASSEKRSAAAERWNEQHSKQPGVKRELRHLSKLIRGAGASSGSAESQQVRA